LKLYTYRVTTLHSSTEKAWPKVGHSVTISFVLVKVFHPHVCCSKFQPLFHFWGRQMSHHVCTVLSLSLHLFKRESFLTWAGVRGLKYTREFRCLCGTLVGVPLDLMDILACFACLFLFVDLCTVFHSHCSILYSHIFSVYSVPAFPCCLVTLAIFRLAVHMPLWRSSCHIPFIFNCVLCFPWWSLGDPYTCWKWISCLNAQGLMMLAKGKDKTRLPKDRLLNWQCREDWKDTWKKIKKVDAHHVQKQTQVGWNLTATNKQANKNGSIGGKSFSWWVRRWLRGFDTKIRVNKSCQVKAPMIVIVHRGDM